MIEAILIGLTCIFTVIALFLAALNHLIKSREKKKGKNTYYLNQQSKGGL